MGLSSALATAMSGLRANQAALSIVSSNIANAQTPGYVTQTANQIEVASGGAGSQRPGHRRQPPARSVRPEPVAHRNLRRRLCRPDGQYSRPVAERLRHAGRRRHARNHAQQFHHRAAGAVDQFRAASPRRPSALAAAQSLAQQLNATTQGIQSLRTNVEQDIGTSVGQANADMSQIAKINTQLQGLSPTDPAAATLMDQRDNAISNLSKLMDIRAVTDCIEPGQRVHQLRHPAGRRRPGLEDDLHLAGSAERQLALQHQPGQVRRRLADDQAAERRHRSTWSPTTRSVRARSRPT